MLVDNIESLFDEILKLESLLAIKRSLFMFKLVRYIQQNEKQLNALYGREHKY